jgi:hypothetical protein
MRRQPRVVRALSALVALWLAASVSSGGARRELGMVFGRVRRETAAASAPHATIELVAAPRQASPSDGPARPFLPSRGFALRVDAAIARSAFAPSNLRERPPLTATYDATAPPATPRTVH